ncbi:MAG: trypsin-like serine peptidase, partial [Spongiibacteraceae bacterium]
SQFIGFFPSSAQVNKDLRQQLWLRPGVEGRVARLFTVFSPSSGASYESQCSATLIANEWLLTAAHCFYSAAGAPVAVVTAVSVEGLGAKSTRREAVAEVWVHRAHDEADDERGELFRYSGSDIALLRLAKESSSELVPNLSSLLPRTRARVQSVGFPRDKQDGGLWSSRCSSELLDSGNGARAAVYSFGCVSAPGQSGAAIYDGWSVQGDIVGVLSANARSKQMNTSVYAAFTPGIIAAIKALLTGERDNAVFGRLPFTYMASAELNKLP